MANNLLHKGILSNDDSIFHANPEDMDTIITEKQVASPQQAFAKIIAEYRSVHFCLLFIHVVLIVGISGHFMTILKDLKNETKICMVLNPSSYSFFLAHCLITLATSVLCLRKTADCQISIWFLEQIRKAYYVSMVFGLMMLSSMFLANHVCKIRTSINYWSIFWALIAIVESSLLLSYVSYFSNELHDIGFLTEAEMLSLDKPEGTVALGTIKAKPPRLVPEATANDTKSNIHDFSMTSITTV